jgi:hypothetical protein
MNIQQRKQPETDISSFNMAATDLSPAQSLAWQLAVMSGISMLESADPSAGEATAMSTITRPFSITPTSQATPTPTPSDNQAEGSAVSTSSPTSYSNYLKPTSTTASPTSQGTTFQVGFGNGNDNNSGWGNMASGTHIGVIVSIIIAVILIVFFSFWFCCGGRAWWSRKHDPHPTDAGGLPLYTMRNGRNTQPGVHRAEVGGDAPPVYEEVAPPQHQTLARGLRSAEEVQRAEVEEAIVSDGKTPLSEIPFEDVVLERYPSGSESSSSASREFQQRHHGMGGDTRGHTNT